MDLKEPKTISEQIQILKDRGCEISDVQGCTDVLRTVNYYRLSAYFLPFRARDHSYLPGTSFYTVYRLYEFDRKVREVLWSAIGVIEIALRTQFAYFHAHRFGADGYLNATNYNKWHDHQAFLDNFSREVKQNERSLFVKHHLANYNGVFPIWVAVELFSFGMLSRFYADMPTKCQKTICRRLGHPSYQTLVSWLKCCTDLRNICAHYGRLYGRTFTSTPRTPTGYPATLAADLFGYIMMLKELYPFRQRWNSEVYPSLCSVMDEYADSISLPHIGFPENWRALLKA